mmetsp:Transcript_13724/g.23213  ORF Transcript_13724/g.23213 Transcript_13724/m.23213 type:complete len:201 (+) Transcript_13724:434-1036(+)
MELVFRHVKSNFFDIALVLADGGGHRRGLLPLDLVDHLLHVIPLPLEIAHFELQDLFAISAQRRFTLGLLRIVAQHVHRCALVLACGGVLKIHFLLLEVELRVEGFGSRDELLVVVHEFHERTVDRDILAFEYRRFILADILRLDRHAQRSVCFTVLDIVEELHSFLGGRRWFIIVRHCGILRPPQGIFSRYHCTAAPRA